MIVNKDSKQNAIQS